MIAWRGMSSTDSIMPARNSRSAGLHGAKVTPQLPISAVVTPCQLIGVRSGSQPICASRWVCRSMKPGETTCPSASISRVPLRRDLADLGDAAALDADVAAKGFCAGAVDDGSAANDDVMGHLGVLPLRYYWCASQFRRFGAATQ